MALDINAVLLSGGMTLLLCAAVFSTLLGLPGNLLVLLLAAGYGFYEGFQIFDPGFLGLLLGIYLAGEGAEFLAAAVGAKKAKASRAAVVAAYIGGFAGALLGTMLLPVIGTILGSAAGGFAASYSVEYSRTDKSQAMRVAVHVVVAQGLGLLAKMAAGVSMAALVLLRWPLWH
ncbi:DUF456 domain-containing protein [Acetonema longum]|uniref:DUF456 domain-containing protein n=1 Tax=Acetonema longum DSM 6540 TaxID=1009370 RepID=F7NEM4_9FIRM|nr:DUF456 domain-containing protein [Acetonema longum]EGO65435.1 hypothetical protein ALO_02436 [Acetonema longum DSM 6540]